MIKSFGIGLLAGALVTVATPAPRLAAQALTRTVTSSNPLDRFTYC